jgi:hypothetical protein
MVDALQILSVILVAVAMVPALAHALELPGKLRLTRDAYFAIQPIYYPGFTIAGISEPVAIIDGTTGTEHGKWVSIWKKQTDGTWKVAVEIYNTDAPPLPHQHP